jgi:hypothetical protein
MHNLHRGPKGQRIANYTTTVGFIDPIEHAFMSLPDADGNLIATGNLQDIDELGTLISPITAQSSDGRLTKMRTGVGWETINVTEQASEIKASLELGGFSYCFVPRSVCWELCNDKSISWDSAEGQSCRTYSCRFPLPRKAFFNVHGGPNCSIGQHHANYTKAAAAPKMDAILIEGPLPSKCHILGLGPHWPRHVKAASLDDGA